jgi:hypothetical protein
MELIQPPKSLPGSKLQEYVQALKLIAQQRPDDLEARRRSQTATDLYHESWPHHDVPKPLTAPNPAETSRPKVWIPSLPTEIYEIIFDLIVAEYPSTKVENERRVRTFVSLTCSCRLFQIILEMYLYKHPRSCRLSWGQYYNLLFRFYLTIEPRRALLVQSLSVNVEHKLCPNLSHLEVSKSTGWLSSPDLEYLGHLFSVCPKVTRFSLKVRTITGISFASESSERFSKFWNQLTHLEALWYPVTSEIIELSKRCPSLQRLKMDGDCTATVESLLNASLIWGKTLKTLYVSGIRKAQSNSAIYQLMERLPVVEEFLLCNESQMTSTIHALTRLSSPRLKRFKGIHYDHTGNRIAPAELETAVCDMIAAHAGTLESISLFSECDLSMSVLEEVKKAKKLKFVNLPLPRVLTDDELEGLVAACPKLEGCSRNLYRMTHQRKYSEIVWLYLDDESHDSWEEDPKYGSWGIIPDVKEESGPEILQWAFWD